MPDFMHEWELGVWKAVFIHILHLLVALGGDAIQTFDARYAKMFCEAGCPLKFICLYFEDFVRFQHLAVI